MAASSTVECGDFLEFQDALKKMRTVDDKIVYMLNTSIPTESFKGQVDPTATCKQLYEELKSSYDTREAAIKKCITLTAERVKELKVQRESRVDDISLLKNLRKEQTKLRLLQSELNVEEVVKERSTKVYYERCRPFFKPADIEL
ncbi:protein MIX23 isoform X1 [Schistocerca americana]|uniref:protein MIX23 isoform X1 n=2 Tax=Schistocerca americana TaxID=7009 RepID=UPI001F4FD0B1|nr:protein MIX23 isoform X1 [Schistocerca americana]XP_047105675.1 protein MIX23 isoform X1 [Schistocerca piceifrons]XP_049762857.1 protein MIX23 isoform X1 [Schistocerca cancellata]XP_049835816.1 protein MIX23 isoform X1 [Schistocerca gregaria]XP_049940626.1 protein MIX23 isoform X1 [Schistocerca serialis cubense]